MHSCNFRSKRQVAEHKSTSLTLFERLFWNRNHKKELTIHEQSLPTDMLLENHRILQTHLLNAMRQGDLKKESNAVHIYKIIYNIDSHVHFSQFLKSITTVTQFVSKMITETLLSFEFCEKPENKDSMQNLINGKRSVPVKDINPGLTGWCRQDFIGFRVSRQHIQNY